MGLYKFLDNKRTLWFMLALVVALIIISILTSNVYRHAGLQGTVYVWNDAPAGATSQAYVFDKATKEALAWTPPAGMNVTPLGGAYIYYKAVYRNTNEDDVLTISGRDGTYSKTTSRWKVTGNIALSINCTKDGYQTAYASATNQEGFFYSGGMSVAYFILVPEK